MNSKPRQVGFPEGQILPYCGGDVTLCAELVAAYHAGEQFPATGKPDLDRVLERLTKTPGYGAGKP